MVVFVALIVAFLIRKFLFVIMFAVDCKCDRIFSEGNLERRFADLASDVSARFLNLCFSVFNVL